MLQVRSNWRVLVVGPPMCARYAYHASCSYYVSCRVPQAGPTSRLPTCHRVRCRPAIRHVQARSRGRKRDSRNLADEGGAVVAGSALMTSSLRAQSSRSTLIFTDRPPFTASLPTCVRKPAVRKYILSMRGAAGLLSNRA